MLRKTGYANEPSFPRFFGSTMQAMLTFAAMNLKKLAAWLWKTGRPTDQRHAYFIIFTTFNKKLRCVGAHTGVCLQSETR
ncbi:hypothetical protein ABEV74_19645 [Paenibacillus cisolokensis]